MTDNELGVDKTTIFIVTLGGDILFYGDMRSAPPEEIVDYLRDIADKIETGTYRVKPA